MAKIYARKNVDFINEFIYLFKSNKIISSSQALIMGKNKKKQQSSNKAQKIFKVATSSDSSKKSKQKKAKEIPKKLKQLDLKTKAKVDSQLQQVHLQMVSKKEKKVEKPVGRKKGAAVNTEKVQEILDKMNVQ
jgi:hypothetical protein